MNKEQMNALCKKLCARKDEWLLLLRLAVGPVFIQAGWGKFQNFDRTVGYFSSIGIPFPELNTALASGTEVVGGILILVGFMTQVISIPLAFVMLVAVLTAHLGDISSFTDLVSLKAFIYLVIFLLLSSIGAGKWSLDGKCCPSQNCDNKDA